MKFQHPMLTIITPYCYIFEHFKFTLISGVDESMNTQYRAKFFYGWIIVAASTAIYLIIAGPITSFGVFVKPIAAAFGWTRAATVMGFTLFLLCNGLFAFISGHLSDRYGPQKVIASGGFLLGLGFYLTSYINNLFQFYLTYSLLGGLGFSCLYIPLTTTISRWFVKKNGLALGIFYAGAGVGGLILAPLIQLWILKYGWRTAFAIVGILTGCIIIPLSFLIKRDPAQIGQVPLGANEIEKFKASGNAQMQAVKSYTVSQALKTKALWINNTASTLTFCAITMVQINMVPHATDRGITSTTAALVLGFAAACNASGRLIMGTLSDKIGTKRALGISVFSVSIMVFFLIGVKTPLMFFAIALPFGFAYGGCIPQTPRVIAELFGKDSMGAIMGVNAIFTSLGPAFGPVIGAFIFDQTGSYSLAFLLGGLFALCGFGLYMMLNLPRKQ